MMPSGTARLLPAVELRASDALAWVEEAPGAAIAMMVMRARDGAVEVSPTSDAQARLDAAVARALAAGATRALAWQAVGRVAEGRAMTVVAATGPSRKVARAALELLHDGIHGVTTRRDVEL